MLLLCSFIEFSLFHSFFAFFSFLHHRFACTCRSITALNCARIVQRWSGGLCVAISIQFLDRIRRNNNFSTDKLILNQKKMFPNIPNGHPETMRIQKSYMYSLDSGWRNQSWQWSDLLLLKSWTNGFHFVIPFPSFGITEQALYGLLDVYAKGEMAIKSGENNYAYVASANQKSYFVLSLITSVNPFPDTRNAFWISSWLSAENTESMSSWCIANVHTIWRINIIMNLESTVKCTPLGRLECYLSSNMPIQWYTDESVICTSYPESFA